MVRIAQVGADKGKPSQKLSRQEIRILCAIGLLIGIGTLYTGETGSCDCPAQIVGQPLPFNQFMAEVNIGLILIIVSLIGLAFSFRKSKTTPK